MDIKPASAKSFIAKPDPAVQVFVFYGSDEGLIREWSERLARQVVEDPQDPFRLADLDGAAVNSDPSVLYDEAAAMSFGGGQRVVRVRRLSGRMADAVVDFIKTPTGDARVLMEAAGANKTNALVKAAIGSQSAAAVPCYHDESRSLRDLVSEALSANGMSPGPGVVDYICDHAGSDRALTRREIEKLALFVGAEPDGEKKAVTIESVQEVVGDTALLTIDSLVDAVFDGRLPDVERSLHRVRREGIAGGTVLRAAATHTTRILRFQSHMNAGLDKNAANRKLRPPVHFTRLDSLTRHARLRTSLLNAILDRIAEGERLSRTTGMPETTVCARVLSGIASAVKK